jgi:hypothetical protein
MFLRVGPSERRPTSPDTPQPPEQKSLQAKATTCGEPWVRRLPGVLFCGGSRRSATDMACARDDAIFRLLAAWCGNVVEDAPQGDLADIVTPELVAASMGASPQVRGRRPVVRALPMPSVNVGASIERVFGRPTVRTKPGLKGRYSLAETVSLHRHAIASDTVTGLAARIWLFDVLI